jgi:hypothetical protein
VLASGRANQTRLKTGSELGRKMISGEGFSRTIVRQVLFASSQVVKSEQVRDGLSWLRTEVRDYWGHREKAICILEYLARLGRISGMDHWQKESDAARFLAGAVRNDHI